MIKAVLTLMTFLFVFSTICQETGFSLSIQEQQVIYRGLVNKIQINTSANPNSYNVHCPNCITFNKITESNTYRVHPGLGQHLEIIIESKDSTIIQNFKIPILDLPDPILFFGATKNGNKCSRETRTFFAKYTPQMNLNAEFEIVKWEITFGDIKFMGNGKTLDEEAQKYLKSIAKETTMFSVIVIVKGQDGINRRIGGAFSL